VEVTVHETESIAGTVSYTARITYSYRRATTRKWEFSENIPATAIAAAISLLQRAAEFIEKQTSRIEPSAKSE
jgi:hypothetical protein